MRGILSDEEMCSAPPSAAFGGSFPTGEAKASSDMEEQGEVKKMENMEQQVEMQQETVEQPAAAELPQQDLIDFVRAHPGLDARSIPNQVWDAVRSGEKLAHAYDRHELQQLRQSNRQLQHRIGLLQSGADNRRNALGSMRSAGGLRTADSFLEGFNED